MKKAKLSLPQQVWSGLVTKYPAQSDHVSPDQFTTGTTNIDTNVYGVVSKRLGGVDYGTLVTSVNDQFEAIFADGTRHLLVMDNGHLKYTVGDQTYTTVKTGYTASASMEFAMYQDRVYFCNGINNAQVYDNTVSYGGAYSLPVTLTVVDYTGLAGDTVTIGSTTLTEGVDWTAATSNDATAASLALAIDGIADVSGADTGADIAVTSEEPYIIYHSAGADLSLASVSAPRVKDAGAAAPTSALTAATGGAGNVPAGTYTYKVTYLYYDTSESNGGTVSASVSPGVASQINLTAIPIGPYGVTARKIYRVDSSGEYRLVLTISDNTTTAGTDDSAVGTSFIPIDNGTPPQYKHVAVHLDRLWMCGVLGRTADLFWTEAGQPDVVRSTNYIACNSQDPTTGVVIYQDKPVVMNRASFGVVYGSTSDTFRYAPIPGSIGCVDNRSIQVRTINGIPTLLWLSEKGFYLFNGSTVDYISDAIEPTVNLNIQQADFAKGSNTDSTEADFTAGTASDAIVLNDPSGSITVPDPQETYDTQTAWETAGAAGVVNVVTQQTATQLPSRIGSPLGNTVDYVVDEASGTAGVTATASSLTLEQATDFTGETLASAGYHATRLSNLTDNYSIRRIATKISIGARPGVLTSFAFTLKVNNPLVTPTNVTASYQVYADSFGTPGALVHETTNLETLAAGNDRVEHTYTCPTVSWSLAANTDYWLVVVTSASGGVVGDLWYFQTTSSAWSGAADTLVARAGGAFSTAVPIFTASPPLGPAAGSYAFTQTAVTSSGTWVGEAINVGFLSDATVGNIYLDNTTGTYPSGSTSTMHVDASDDSAFGTYDTDSATDLNGATTLSLPRRRYYRLRVELSTTDDRNVPALGESSIGFGTTAAWTGPGINCTSDISDLNSLTVVATLPAGTNGTYAVQSSSDDGAGDAYTNVATGNLSDGSQTIDLTSAAFEQYLRLVFTLVGNDNTATAVAQVSSANLAWTTTSTFESAEINAGLTPAGWDIFATDTTSGGGTVAYAMKSAASSGALGAATYYSVTSGAFPPSTVVPLQYSKWRATITATAGNVPIIDSVTVGWFESNALAPIRAASLFYNKTYYIALAEAEETANNIVLVFDENNRWYRYDSLGFSTMGIFYNRPLVGLNSAATLVRWLSGDTDQGSNIDLDIRTKAFDFGDPTKTKVFRSLTAVVENTGATWSFTYSIDGGTTFSALTDYQGNTSFTTATDGALTIRKFAPAWGDQISGRTIMIRGVSGDSNPAKLYELYIDAFIREGEPTHV